MGITGLIATKMLVFLPATIWRFVMKPIFVNWWRKTWSDHFKRAVRNENMSIKAINPFAGIPYLKLFWVVNNGSEAKVQIKRIYGNVYVGDCRFSG